MTAEGELRHRTYDQEGQKHTGSEVHIIPGRGKIRRKRAAVAEVAGEFQQQASAPQHNQ